MFGAIMAATSLAGGLYSAYEQREAGKAQQAMANAQAKQAQQQAENESIRAGLAQVETEKEAQRRYTTLSQDLGAVYAGAAGNGVLLNSGSVDSIARANIIEAKSDVSNIFDQGNLTIQGHNDNAKAHAEQAAMYRFQGEQARKAANRSAFGSIISGVGGAVSGGLGGFKLGTAINQRYGSDRWFSDRLLK